MATKIWTWHQSGVNGDLIVSTNVDLLDRSFIQKAFASEDVYWAWPLSDEDLELMLAKSTTLGLYQVLPNVPPPKSADSPSSPRTPSPTLESPTREVLTQVAMARLVTDNVTTVYLTDVFVDPASRSQGHLKWLMKCCNEIFDAMPNMRRSFLVANPTSGKQFYAQQLGMNEILDERERLVCMTRRYFKMD